MRTRVMLTALAGAAILAAGCETHPTTAELSPRLSPSLAPAPGGAWGHGRSPLAALLARREALGLTDEQVARLRAIQAELAAQNQPLHEKLRAALPGPGVSREELKALSPEERRARVREAREAQRKRLAGMTPAERQALRDERAAAAKELKPVLDQIRANTRAAMEQARGVLTTEQRARLKERLAAREAQGKERGRPHPRPRR